MKFDPSNPKYRSQPSRIASAIREPFNAAGLTGLVALSAALVNAIPVMCGIAVEVVYLLVVPNTSWFTRRLEARFDAEVRAHRSELRDKVFPKVQDDVVERFNWLEQARSQIEQTSKVQDNWFREALRKLDFLLEKYLQFAEREADFLSYLRSLLRESYGSLSAEELRNLPSLARYKDAAQLPHDLKVSQQDVEELIEAIKRHYESEIESLTNECESETVLATREVLTKRKEVLNRRREFIIRLRAMMENLRHQMELITESFGLINDEMRARSPEQVLADIDDVVAQATSLTDALDSMTPSTAVAPEASLSK